MDFKSHHGNINPVQEAIAKKMQALSNVTDTNSLVSKQQLIKSMKELEVKIHEILAC